MPTPRYLRRCSWISECNVTSNSAKSIFEILHDLPKLRKLQIELAITVDAMDQFVRATYLLEEDGPLALSANETLVQAMNTKHYPTVSRTLANGDARHEQQLIAYAKTCAYAYFKSKLRGILSQPFLHHTRTRN